MQQNDFTDLKERHAKHQFTYSKGTSKPSVNVQYAKLRSTLKKKLLGIL